MIRLLVFILFMMPLSSWAAGGGNYFPHDKANINPESKVSLQNGAKVYVNYCFGCHSMKYQRFQRVAEDLEIPKNVMQENLIFGEQSYGDLMTISMEKEDAEKWFGALPPDLTLVARVRGTDWLYNYLRAFYVDKNRPYGVNNTVFKDVGMPHVLAPLQGVQVLGGDKLSFEIVEKGSLSPEEYDNTIRDLVNFLAYSGEPIKAERESLGVKVLLFILLFFGCAYALKKEYWKDIH